MEKYLLTFLTFLLLICLPQISLAQEGIVSGIMSDDSGEALIGATIQVKGTTQGTVTDIDGKYSIRCKVGDELIFSYTGFSTYIVPVTAQSFDRNKTKAAPVIPIHPIHNKAYTKAIQQYKTGEVEIDSSTISKYIWSGKNTKRFYSYDLSKVKNIIFDSLNQKIKIVYVKPETTFQLNYTNNTSVQFVQDKNLPNIQKIYSQGIPVNGENIFANVPFSFGPKIENKAALYDKDLFKNGTSLFNSLYFRLNNENTFWSLKLDHLLQKNIFDQQQKNYQQAYLKYSNYHDSNRNIKWKGIVNYFANNNQNANINAFQNKILFNHFVTPPSFDNKTLSSFDPQFNNPFSLLDNTINEAKHKKISSIFDFKTRLDSDLILNGSISYVAKETIQEFGLVKQTIGFQDGYYSEKTFRDQQLETKLVLNYYNQIDNDLKFEWTTMISNRFNYLDYRFLEQKEFEGLDFQNPQEENTDQRYLSQNVFSLLNQAEFSYRGKAPAGIFLQNNSLISSTQENAWFLPTIQFHIDLTYLLDDIDWVNYCSVFIAYSQDAKELSLYCQGQSHNSLRMNPSESLAYVAARDLFVNEGLRLERTESTELGIDTRLFSNHLGFGLSLYERNHTNSIFPIYNNGQFELQNVANIQTRGAAANFHVILFRNGNVNNDILLSFSKEKSKVVELLNGADRIPIAGFSTISKNLIEGSPTGVIVGSAFLKNENGQKIIGADGFPLVDPELKIIADPTPDFHLGFSNKLKWKDFSFEFVFDFQKGGQVWNGTQNVLNYYGSSQETAALRNTTNFVFEGVTSDGKINTKAIDFANSQQNVHENRWTRYGFAGVGEEAIVDASYLNLSAVQLSYKIHPNDFIKEVQFMLYGHNLLMLSDAPNASPYSALFGNSSATGLHFFNTPLASSLGLKIHVKI